MAEHTFAAEPLESRLEQFCIAFPYISTCDKTVWFICIPYPCVKFTTVCC